MRQTALVNVIENQADQEDDVACLPKVDILSFTTPSVCLAVHLPLTSEVAWFLDIGAFAHRSFEKEFFVNYVAQDLTSVQVEHRYTVLIHGRGDKNLICKRMVTERLDSSKMC